MSVPTPVLSTVMQRVIMVVILVHLNPIKSYQRGFRGGESKGAGDTKEAVLGLKAVKCWGT